MIKIITGSNYLFKNVPGFVGQDKDYLIIKPTDKIFYHRRVNTDTCYFVWTTDKNSVRRYIDNIPRYLNATNFVFKWFVEYYEYQHTEVVRQIDKVLPWYKHTEFAYYIPFFEYVKAHFDWDFPNSVVNEAYQIYLKVKKKA